MNKETVLKVDDIDVYYGDLQALRSVSIKANKGEIISVIGANGSGKSTLLNTLGGLLTPRKGDIQFNNERMNGLRPDETVDRGIALVPEGRRVFSRMSVIENLIMGSFTKKSRANKVQNLDRVYDLFPKLEDRSSQRADTFSGGEQQMLAIGRGLMSGPDLLLCDEISLGLAPIVIKEIYRKLQKINENGITLVLVEQDIHQSMKIADYVYVLLEGKVILEGKPSMLTIEEVKEAYFGV